MSAKEMEPEIWDLEQENSFLSELNSVRLSPLKSSPSNFEAVTSIYRRSRTKVYNKIIQSHSPIPLDPSRMDTMDRDSPSLLYGSGESTDRKDRSLKPFEIGPPLDSPSSFYFYKRRDLSKEKLRKEKSDASKFGKIKPIELLPVKVDKHTKNRSDLAFLKVKSEYKPEDFEDTSYSKPPISMHRVQKFKLKHNQSNPKGPEHHSLPPVRGRTKYSNKIQKIISACDKMPAHKDMTARVNVEKNAVAEMNRQLEWTTDALNRIQDSDAAMLEYLFGKLEEEELDFFNEISEVKRYFKYFSNNPAKQLRMVSKMLKRKKNVLL
mmetsp:Transcript_24014/g.42622  ORF Transcript_24014/g.42622 Transcript_24014/m.42622 type:complete len:322 (+) Transcript_24014:2166-3131(+)